ncbi:predicted protein [Sclerotinia sclerotiorum 1980 UF-70]|uniref:DDE-1 domain-containing protein n=1 Tax=Sclerotinia sclerotiorum (strain ATCC 18683 / 1980 / Ss-1) TaxID=665079 RepID=A7EJN3_SCLS1|nr:predicted protein [Sclerotinia sclerotiorum 1980 UF-70]EDO03049.1 predicted protein [Sclerotinia sclerotiorum 1980 UF-70]
MSRVDSLHGYELYIGRKGCTRALWLKSMYVVWRAEAGVREAAVEAYVLVAIEILSVAVLMEVAVFVSLEQIRHVEGPIAASRVQGNTPEAGQGQALHFSSALRDWSDAIHARLYQSPCKHDIRDYKGARVKRTTVIAIECISNDGSYLNTMIIWPANSHRSNWTTFPTPKWQYACSDSEFCFKNNILLCRLPFHTSHKLQPCDVAVFAPLKATYRETAARYFNRVDRWID